MNTLDKKDANRDPISGEPGSHPLGTAAGAVPGAIAGATIGAAGGPVGVAVGAIVGGVAGGLAGKGVAEAIDPTAEDAYWSKQYTKEPYYTASRAYDDYAPAYRVGYNGYSRYAGKRYDEVESNLEREYNAAKGASKVAWNDAKHATRAAWNRVERAIPGDFDRDGK